MRASLADALLDSPEALPVSATPASGVAAAEPGATVAAADAASPADRDLALDVEHLDGEVGPLRLRLVFDGRLYWLLAAAVDGLVLPEAVAGACSSIVLHALVISFSLWP